MRPIFAPLAFTLLYASTGFAAPAPLKVAVEGIDEPNAPIPHKYAVCQPGEDGKSKGGDNIRPEIAWSDVPEGTKSFAIVVTDPDVPASFDDAGKEGKVVKADAPRQRFYHWALADIPATVRIIEGGDSAVAPEIGKGVPSSMEKYVDSPTQFGGPCPPWNDERVHHYHFTVYALDVAKLPLKDNARAEDVEAAAKKHAIAQGEMVGTYTLNKALMK